MCVPFHALFSPSPREAAPSVSKFICDTSSGLVWSRGRLHTLFTSASAETRCVCVCVCCYLHTLCTEVFALLWFSSFICVFTLGPTCLYFSHMKKCAWTHLYMHLQPYACVCPFACVWHFYAYVLCLCIRVFTLLLTCVNVCVFVHLCACINISVCVCEPQVC